MERWARHNRAIIPAQANLSARPSRQAGLLDGLGLRMGSGLVSIVGGGGKSSLLFALGDQLPGHVILTTTTRIFRDQMQRTEQVFSLDDANWMVRLADAHSPVLLVGSVSGERAIGVPSELPGRLLAQPGVDWVAVEADGSRMRPVKAPADHEPVIPPETNHVVVVAGADALSAPISQIAHRPERVSRLTGLAMDQVLTAEALANLLASPEAGRKSVPRGASFSILLNKVETGEQKVWAARVAELALEHTGVDRVLAGQLRPGSSLPWEVWAR